MPSAVLPLNDFQRLMRNFEEFQTFYGIDAIEVKGEVDAEELRAAAEEELTNLGVGLPVVAADGRSVTYREGRPSIAVDIFTPAAETPSMMALADYCSVQLNRPFRPNEDPIARVWIVRSTPHPHVGMTWQHWPIDGVSGADLFRRILARTIGCPLANDATATELTAPDVRAAFGPWLTWRRRMVYLRETLRQYYRVSRVFSVPRPQPERATLRVHLLDLHHPVRPEGATLNDVVAAALIWAISDVLPERHRNGWRRCCNLMNFVDLRPFGGAALQRAWGLYLGFFCLNMPERRPASWLELIRSFRDQSLRVKNRQTFFASLSALRTFRKLWPWLPGRLRWTLPSRVAPFTAALTNTRHRGDWTTGPLADRFGRSWRIAPLGCLSALTANVCTKGDELSLALTCEDNSFVSQRIEFIEDKMRELLDRRSATG